MIYTASKKRLGIVVASVASAVLLVILGTWVVWVGLHSPTQPGRSHLVLATGPNFSFQAFQSPNGVPAWSPAVGSWVTVTSVLPSSVPNGPGFVNFTSGPNIELQLFQGVTGSGGVISGSLNLTNWTTVSTQWPSYDGASTAQVSMWMDSTFQAYSNTSQVWELYTYRDSIPFNPSSPPPGFTAAAYFNLAKPAAPLPGLPPPGGAAPSSGLGGTGNGSAESNTTMKASAMVRPDGVNCGPNPQPKWKTNWDGYVTGPFPVLMGNDTQRHSGGSPDFVLTNTVAGGTTTFDFTGAGGSYAYGSYSTTAGTSISWGSKPTTFSAAGPGVDALSESQYSFGVIYLDNVTLHGVRKTETLTYYTQPRCAVVTQQVQYVTTTVVGMTDTGFHLKVAHWNSGYGSLLTSVIKAYSNQIANLTTASGNYQTWAVMTGYATGYSNAQALQHQVQTVASFFLTTLDLGFLVMEAFETCGVFCDAGGVADALSVVGDYLGLMSAINAAEDSFAFTVSTSQNLSAMTASAVGGAFSFQVSGESYPTNWQTSTGSVSVKMPDYIVGW